MAGSPDNENEVVVRMKGEGGNETVMAHLDNESEVVVRMEMRVEMRPLLLT